MNERIKVGSVYLEIPKGSASFGKLQVASAPVVAHRPDTPEELEDEKYGMATAGSRQNHVPIGRAQPRRTEQAEAAEQSVDAMTEWIAFAGGRSPYPQQWLKYREGGLRHGGFNSWAFMFGVQWFFAHKMYLQGMLSLVLEGVVPGAIVVWAGVTLRGSAYLQNDYVLIALSLVIFIVPRIAIGYWANIALFRKAMREIEKVKALGLGRERHLALIAAIGAVSIPSVIFLYIAVGLVRVALSYR